MRNRKTMLALLIANIVLLLCLGVLYYKNYEIKSNTAQQVDEDKTAYLEVKKEREDFELAHTIEHKELASLEKKKEASEEDAEKMADELEQEVEDYLSSVKKLDDLKDDFAKAIGKADIPDGKKAAVKDGLYQLVDKYVINDVTQAQKALLELYPEAGSLNAFQLVSENADGSFTFTYQVKEDDGRITVYKCTIDKDGKVTEDSYDRTITPSEELTEQEAIQLAIDYHNELDRPSASLKDARKEDEEYLVVFEDRSGESYAYAVSMDGTVREKKE